MSESTRAVFISYAREDTEVARRIADALRSHGVEVWFDQNELRGGDAWDQKIRKQINDCTVFLPIISQHTQERGKGYFRLEWKLAVEQTHLMAEGMAFLAPVVVDGTSESGALVPPEFMRVQWTRLPGALPTPQFVEQVKKLLETPAIAVGRDRLIPPAVSPAHAAGSGDPALQKKPAIPGWIWGAVAAGVVAVAAGVMLLRKPEPPAAPPKAAAETAPATPVAPKFSDKSIAVLPFTNMSTEKDSEFFTDGIHEDILTNLALVHELRVVSRTSVMPYRTTNKSMRQIAQELGVAYILEGSVRRSGNKVRVTGQLIHAATDEHVWAQAYDRDLTDVFGIQAELSQQIAAALKAALSPEEKVLLARRPTENLAAYDTYVKARQVRENGDLTTGPEVETMLQEAVRLDPKFAQAWAELASFHAQAYFNDFDHSAERLAKAKAAVDTAVRLAPDAPEVIERLGDYYYYGYRDYARATEQYQRLAVLRPNDAAVFGSLGFIHRRQGRWSEAVTELRRAVQLEPRNLRYGRTFVQLTLGLNLYDEALAVQRQIVAQFPENLTDASQLMFIPVLAQGSEREGKAWLAQLKPGPKDETLVNYLRKAWAAGGGDLEAAIRLDRQQQYFEGFGESHWSQDTTAALVLLAHGDTVLARARAEQAVTGGKIELERSASPTAWVTISTAYAVLGNKTEALRCAQVAKDLVPEASDSVAGPPLSLNYAQILAWCGDKDRAIAEFARLLRTPFGANIHASRLDLGWLPLRGDPRFEALLNDEKNNAPLP